MTKRELRRIEALYRSECERQAARLDADAGRASASGQGVGGALGRGLGADPRWDPPVPAARREGERVV